MGNQTSGQNSSPNQERTTKKIEITPYNVNKKIRLAIIGIGDRLRGLISNLDLMHPELIDVVAIADESKDALELAKLGYSKPTDHVKFYEDYKVMFEENKDLDWVMIGSKNCHHFEHCMASFSAGVNVFCEKPLATSINDCIQMKDMWQKTGKHFVTGFVLRHAPIYEKALHLIQEGFIGKIVSIDANEHLSPDHGGYIMRNWRRFKKEAGPHILEKCCHDIDIINMLLGSKPEKVAAFGGLDIFIPQNQPKSTSEQAKYKLWTSWEDVDPFTSEKDIEDNIVCILQYQNGAKVSFNVISNSAWPQQRMRINGIQGTIELDLCNEVITWQKILGQRFHETFEGGVHGGGDKFMLAELCEVMATGKQPKVSMDEGFISTVVWLAIDEARETNSIMDLKPCWKNLGLK